MGKERVRKEQRGGGWLEEEDGGRRQNTSRKDRWKEERTKIRRIAKGDRGERDEKGRGN